MQEPFEVGDRVTASAPTSAYRGQLGIVTRLPATGNVSVWVRFGAAGARERCIQQHHLARVPFERYEVGDRVESVARTSAYFERRGVVTRLTHTGDVSVWVRFAPSWTTRGRHVFRCARETCIQVRYLARINETESEEDARSYERFMREEYHSSDDHDYHSHGDGSEEEGDSSLDGYST